MDNIRIQQVLMDDPYCRRIFQGVFPVNGLPKREAPWPSAYVLTTKSVPTFEINHWVALYITPDGEGELFDSFGEPPKHPKLKNFLRKNTVRTIYNRVQFQGPSPVCGHFAVYFLLERCRGMHPDYIASRFSRDVRQNDKFVENVTRSLLSSRTRTSQFLWKWVSRIKTLHACWKSWDLW